MRNAPTERRGGVIEKENEKHAASQRLKQEMKRWKQAARATKSRIPFSK